MTALLLLVIADEEFEELLNWVLIQYSANDKGNNAITYCCEWQRLIKNFQLKKQNLNLLRNPPPSYFASRKQIGMVMNKLGEEKNLKLGTLEDTRHIGEYCLR